MTETPPVAPSTERAHVELHGSFHEGDEPPPRGVAVMAFVRWLLVAAMAAVAAASLYHVLAPTSDDAHAAHATEYFCPMHPAVVQDQPGTCPICNMSLVARAAPQPHAGHAEASPAESSEPPKGLTPITLTPERVQLIGMRTAQVARGPLPTTLRAPAAIAAREDALSTVQIRAAGWIEELHVAATGEPVARGQLLARLYSPELLAAQEELLNAQRWASGTPDGAELLESARRRLALLGMEPREIDEVARTGTPHRLIEVRSPARGYVADKAALPGLYVQPGAELFRIADLAQVWALVDVFERDAGSLRVGQRAEVTLLAYPGETFAGKVTLVHPVLSTETRTLRARVALKNPGLKLKPGMFAEVQLEVAQAEALLVPREALVDVGSQQYVFVQTAPGRFVPRLVEIAARTSDAVAVRTGLREGETVVTTGNFLLDSESRLRFTTEGLARGESATPSPPADDPCAALFDRARHPDAYAQCRACEVHRGMGPMEEDCRAAIARPGH